MTKAAYRSLYRGLLRLHPPPFRQRFEEEMMATFDEAAAKQNLLGLFADSLLSLTRQWLLRPTSWRVPLTQAAFATSADVPLFAWDRINVSAPGLSAGRLMQGSFISLALFASAWITASQTPHPRIPRMVATQSNAAVSNGDFSSNLGNSDPNAPGSLYEGRYAMGHPSGDLREIQNRQQALAVQAATGTDKIPGALVFQNEAREGNIETPQTPAGKQFSTWLKAFNEGDRTQIEDFQKHFKNPRPGQNVDGELGFRRMTGGFALRKIEESTSTRISGLVQERGSDQFARFVMEVEPDAPHLITTWDLNAIATPADFAIPRMSEPQLIDAAKNRIDDLVNQDRFSGAVLVTKNGKPVLSGAYGMADREKKIANSLDTKFRIGSMNKMFTATSILQLVQSGKIKLNEPFGTYIKDYPNKDVSSKVSIEQLLTHTGGTGDIFGPQFDQHRKDLRTLQDYVNLYGTRGLQFTPGSRWEYSNYGFLLLGVVVERVSGKSYYDYVSQNICAPAGMTSTASLSEDENVPGRSIGYTAMGGSGIHPNTDTLPYRGTSAGGGYSTVQDLQRFANALLNHKLLNAEYTELLTTGKVETPGGGKYAFGFSDQGGDSGVRHFGHGGGAPGMNGDLQIYPQTGYVIAVLSNLDPPAASRVSDFIANRLPKN
jgi:D-alanyl-D-alanine carboxypeptidase